MSEPTTTLEEPTIETAPRLTFAPAAVALAIMFTLWGILTHWTMSVAGLGLLATAIGFWIREICHEWSKP